MSKPMSAVVVHQAADPVDQLRDFLDLRLEEPQGVRVRHHHAGDGVVQQRLQRFHIYAAVLQRLHLHDFQAADGRRSGIRAVGAVRDDDLSALQVAAHHMILAHDH